MTENPSNMDKLRAFFKLSWEKLLTYGERFKQHSPEKRFLISIAGMLGFLILLSFWWGRYPSQLDLQSLAEEKVEDYEEKMVVGYLTTNTLIEVANTLLDKSGGYLHNDLLPPSLFMDDMPSWELGVLQQIRDLTKALRNDISRSRTQSSEDQDLAKADSKFNVDPNSWFWPTPEREYREGIEKVENYLHRLADPTHRNAQFFARADNLRDWLGEVIKRLGSLSQRLSDSVGQQRQNTDLAGDKNARQSTDTAQTITAQTPWSQIDNIFFETRGNCWALIHFLKAIEVDFKDVLETRNALILVRQIIMELESTQKTVWSPLILNGSEFGLFANHSLVLSSYVSRANTGLIELYSLLERG